MMKLWIRSQDKEVLIKTNELEIEENMIIGFINNIADFRYLGTYATKERALEVLDEIQKHIEYQGEMMLDTEDGHIKYGGVYIMPKE